jgi:flagellar hook-basal body complex protein FliE
MTAINTLTVRPDQAISAYQQTSGAGAGAGVGGSFGSMLDRTLSNAVAAGQDADASATNAVVNGGDVTHVVAAVSQAQLALQEVVAVRDKVVQAYQDVMKMTI